MAAGKGGGAEQQMSEPDWRALNAQALVVGRAYHGPDGRLAADVRLWDVLSGRQLAGQRFAVGADDWRRLGHSMMGSAYLAGHHGRSAAALIATLIGAALVGALAALAMARGRSRRPPTAASSA